MTTISDPEKGWRFLELLRFILAMNDRGWIKEDIYGLVREAYHFTHGETGEEGK